MVNETVTEVERFLKFLSPVATHFCCCLLNLDSTRVLPGFGNQFLTPKEALATVAAIRSATLHVTLNQTNDSGHTLSDMEYSRVFCIDFDNGLKDKQFEKLKSKLSPQLIVESSPGKYHFYWASHDYSGGKWGEWSLIQRGLSGLFGGDPNLDQPNHMIRVPGVKRVCKDGRVFVPRIVWEGEGERVELKASHFLESFPGLTEAAEKVLAARKKAGVAVLELVKGAGSAASIASLQEAGVGRNATVYEVAKETAKGLGRELNSVESEELGMRVNGHFEEALGEKELETAIKKGSKKGSKIAGERKEKVKGALSEIPKGSFGEPSGFKYERNNVATKTSPYSELGIAGRVLERFGNRLVSVNRETYAYNEKKELWSPQGKIQDVLRPFVTLVTLDAIHEEEFKEQFVSAKGNFDLSKYQSAVTRMYSAGQTTRIAEYLSTEGSLPQISMFDFDSSPFLLHCPNGMVELETGVMRAVAPEDYSFSDTGVVWEPEAVCPEWKKFIAEVFAENEEPAKMVSFMQEVFGYSLTGDMSAQKIFVHHGAGGNGKSKVLLALSKISGRYITMIGCSTLSKSNGSLSKEFERVAVSFEGRRCVLIDDLDTSSQWNEAYVKNLTSGQITSRRLYAEERLIPNRAKVHVGCNEKPKTTCENEGLIRRLCFVPYPRQFAGGDGSDQRIEKMLRDETPGILQWAHRGFLRWKKRGCVFDYPKEVLSEAREYRSENFVFENELVKVIKENFKPSKTYAMKFEELEKEVVTSLSLSGNPGIKITRQKLGMALLRAGFESIRRATSHHAKARFVMATRIES